MDLAGANSQPQLTAGDEIFGKRMAGDVGCLPARLGRGNRCRQGGASEEERGTKHCHTPFKDDTQGAVAMFPGAVSAPVFSGWARFVDLASRLRRYLPALLFDDPAVEEVDRAVGVAGET